MVSFLATNKTVHDLLVWMTLLGMMAFIKYQKIYLRKFDETME